MRDHSCRAERTSLCLDTLFELGTISLDTQIARRKESSFACSEGADRLAQSRSYSLSVQSLSSFDHETGGINNDLYVRQFEALLNNTLRLHCALCIR